MKKQLTWWLGIIYMATLANAQVAPLPEGAPVTAPATNAAVAVAAEPAPPAAPATPAPQVVAEEPPDEFPFRWTDAPLVSVLQQLGRRAGVNLIIGDGVTGQVTVSLKDMTPMEVMRVIVDAKGYVLREEKGVVKVLTKDAAEMQPTEILVKQLSYAKAAELQAVLEPSLSKQGKVKVDARTNSLILTDTAASLEKVAKLIEALDTQTPQVLIEAKFVETTRDAGKSLGVDWKGVLANRTISITGGGGEEGEGEGGGGLKVTKDINDIMFNKGWTWPMMVIDPGSFSYVFNFLITDSDTDLLASPRVVTMDKKTAKIAISEQVPVPSLSYSEQQGAYVVTGFEWKDIGTILDVTPSINKDGFITLEIKPEVSKTTDKTFPIAGINLSSIDTRTASTVVLIKSGNTLVIGGLTREDVTDSYNKVPIMGDIPGVGALFRHKSLKKTKRELVVFLTPTVISPEMKINEADVLKPLYDPVYVNDKWMPKDNAKPRPGVKTMKSLLHADEAPPSATTPPAPASQNFGPKK